MQNTTLPPSNIEPYISLHERAAVFTFPQINMEPGKGFSRLLSLLRGAYMGFHVGVRGFTHSRKLKWKPKKGPIKTTVLVKGYYMGSHVNLGGCVGFKGLLVFFQVSFQEAKPILISDNPAGLFTEPHMHPYIPHIARYGSPYATLYNPIQPTIKPCISPP